MQRAITLLGEAEKGRFSHPYYIQDLVQLFAHLGHPPKESLGIYFAIQTLLYHKPLLYFRVEEEGYSQNDYMKSLYYLKHNMKKNKAFAALFLPNVSDPIILEEAQYLCLLRKSLLFTTEKDLYDYLTS